MSAIAESISSGRDALPVCLWRENPYRLVSLWDIMKPYYPSRLTYLILALNVSGHTTLDNDVGAASIPNSTREHLLEVLSQDKQVCVDLGLIASTVTIERLLTLLSRPDPTWSEYDVLGKEFRSRLLDKLSGVQFFSMTTSEAECYRNPTKDWKEIIKRWPKTQIDIEESSRCFAFARYAAAIFHVLLVAEYGVVEVARLLGVAGDKPGWGSLDRLEKLLAKPYKDRSSVEQKHSELLKQILPLMLAIKDSWRHKISHVDNKLVWLDTDFSPQIAEEIRTVTRGLMRRLATDLPAGVP